MRSRSLLLSLLTLFALVLGWGTLTSAPPAGAHNSLVSTSPEDGEDLDTAPDEVVLEFNDRTLALGTQIEVTGPSGPVQYGDPRVEDRFVHQALDDNLPAGEYTVTWRVTSADGHPISDTFGFTVKSGAASSPASDPTSGTTSAPTSSPTAVPSASGAGPDETAPDAPEPSPQEAADGSPSTAVLVVGGLSAVALVTGLGLMFARRRSPQARG